MTGQPRKASRFRGTIIGPSVFLAGEKRTTFCRDLSQGGRDSRIRPLSSVGAKGAESGGKSRQIRRPFHPDYYFLRTCNLGEKAAETRPEASISNLLVCHPFHVAEEDKVWG